MKDGDLNPPLVYRLVREIFEGRDDPNRLNVRLELCCAENFVASVGPPAGGEDKWMDIIFEETVGAKTVSDIYFMEADSIVARQLAQALTAWADWVDEQEAEDAENDTTGRD